MNIVAHNKIIEVLFSRILFATNFVELYRELLNGLVDVVKTRVFHGFYSVT